MAPIQLFSRKDEKAVVNMPPILDVVCSQSTHFQEPSKATQNSRFTRCSSLSSEEESFQFLQHGLVHNDEYFRSLAVSVKTKTSVSSVTVCNGTNTFNTDFNWPGVSCGLDEGERRKKAKSKVALELEVERKKAVENDDSSTSENFGTFALFEYEKCTVKTSSQIQLTNEKCELKRKAIFTKDGPLVVPFSVQETLPGTEGVKLAAERIPLQIQFPPLSPSCSEIAPEEDPVSSAEDCAHSYVEEINLEDDKSIETKHRSLFRRHAVKKVKRSIWCITEPEPPAVQPKRKKTCKSVKKGKQRQGKICDCNQFVPEFIRWDEIMQQSSKRPSKKSSKRRVPNSPARGEPKDSGVYSNSAGSSCSGSSSGSGSGSGSGSFSAGGGSQGGSGTHGSGGGNDDGDDREKEKKYPWWHLPNGENLPAPESKKEKKKEDSGGQQKMEVEISGFQTFLPSKVDTTEQCHAPGWGEVASANQKLPLVFSPQDIQHASYCSKANCPNVKCKLVQAEITHMKAHKGWNQLCTQCINTYSVVQQHAKFCPRKGCRVPECENARDGNNTNAKKNLGKPVKPFQPQRVPAQVPRRNAWEPPRTLHCTPLMVSQIDGKVIFRNSTVLPGDYFAEHINYNVIRKDKLGGGTNGAIYPVYLQADRSAKLVVKETNYAIPMEEVKVYQLLGNHENIVKHYGGTFRGSDGMASIFMEKCDMCLFSYMEKLGRRLAVNEAMFYWSQVVHGVLYLHHLPTPVIHKDIKAKNVLLTEENTRAKLADFDSAKRLLDEFTEAGLKPLGTRGFVSPEVWESKPHGRPADVYSLGCFLVELTVGVPSRETLWTQINQLRELDYDLAQLVEKCVQECPEDRPTVRALLEKPVVKKYTRSWKSGSGLEQLRHICCPESASPFDA